MTIRRVLLTAAAAAAWLLDGHGLGLAALVVLIWLTGLAVTAPGNTAKARNTEDRVNAMVPLTATTANTANANAAAVGTLQSQAGSVPSPSGTNTSYPMPGGFDVTYAVSTTNNGGNNSTTSSSSAGTAHTHSMTHLHTNTNDLQDVVNQIQSSYSTTCTQINQIWTALRNAGII